MGDQDQLWVNNLTNIGLAVLVTVVKEGFVFWGVTPCGMLKLNRSLRLIRCHHFHSRRISQERN
jgi:hypothetical protein